jgi:hypothetical protein
LGIWAKIPMPFTLSLDRRKLLRRGPVQNSDKRGQVRRFTLTGCRLGLDLRFAT